MGAGSSHSLRCVAAAAIVAGIASTLAQLGLWWLAGEHAMALLLRDARLTAALVLGREALPPPVNFDMTIMLVASLIHFGLSLLYAALLFPLSRLHRIETLIIGSVFGATLYAVNLHGFTLLFPWFVEARGGITFAAHIAFGVAAMETLRRMRARDHS
jgi:hypothetical protein